MTRVTRRPPAFRLPADPKRLDRARNLAGVIARGERLSPEKRAELARLVGVPPEPRWTITWRGGASIVLAARKAMARARARNDATPANGREGRESDYEVHTDAGQHRDEVKP